MVATLRAHVVGGTGARSGEAHCGQLGHRGGVGQRNERHLVVVIVIRVAEVVEDHMPAVKEVGVGIDGNIIYEHLAEIADDRHLGSLEHLAHGTGLRCLEPVGKILVEGVVAVVGNESLRTNGKAGLSRSVEDKGA